MANRTARNLWYRPAPHWQLQIPLRVRPLLHSASISWLSPLDKTAATTNNVRQSSGNPTQFVRHEPSTPVLVIRTDERRCVKVIRQRVSCDPNGGSGRGSAQEWPLL